MRHKHLTFCIVFLLLCGFVALIAVSEQKTVGQLVKEVFDAHNAVYHPGDGESPPGAWEVYGDAFDVLEGYIDTAIGLYRQLHVIKIGIKSNPGSQLRDGIDTSEKAMKVSGQLTKTLTDIDVQRGVVEGKWNDAYDAWQTYSNAVAAYNSHPDVSPDDRLDVRGLPKYVATEIYLCHGPCDEVMETVSLAQVKHQAYCSEKHGPSGVTGVTYWTCYGNTTCDRSDEHNTVACIGSCGNLGPEQKHYFGPDGPAGWARRPLGRITTAGTNLGTGYSTVTIASHRQRCTKKVSVGIGIFRRTEQCPYYYYQCNSGNTCPNVSNHISGSGNGGTPPNNGGGGDNQPSDNTPNCSDCTEDCSSPCSCTNSGTCGGTVVDNTPNCNDCTDGCSSCPTVCISCGSTYDPDNSYDKMNHGDVECVKCGSYYKMCSSQWGDCYMREPSPGWHHSEE